MTSSHTSGCVTLGNVQFASSAIHILGGQPAVSKVATLPPHTSAFLAPMGTLETRRGHSAADMVTWQWIDCAAADEPWAPEFAFHDADHVPFDATTAPSELGQTFLGESLSTVPFQLNLFDFVKAGVQEPSSMPSPRNIVVPEAFDSTSLFTGTGEQQQQQQEFPSSSASEEPIKVHMSSWCLDTPPGLGVLHPSHGVALGVHCVSETCAHISNGFCKMTTTSLLEDESNSGDVKDSSKQASRSHGFEWLLCYPREDDAAVQNDSPTQQSTKPPSPTSDNPTPQSIRSPTLACSVQSDATTREHLKELLGKALADVIDEDVASNATSDVACSVSTSGEDDMPQNAEHSSHPSIGSRGHDQGDCKRCCFFPRGRCTNGETCSFCHYAHVDRVKSRKKKSRKKSRSDPCFSTDKRLQSNLADSAQLPHKILAKPPGALRRTEVGWSAVPNLYSLPRGIPVVPYFEQCEQPPPPSWNASAVTIFALL